MSRRGTTPPGNIATHTAPGKNTITYSYDKQGQLLGATGGSGYQYSYTYDNVGNILTATKNGTTHTYTYSTYDWKDKLVSYDGQPIAYDASGNPTSYYNGTRWTMTWVNGRELATASSGDTSLAFAYDGSGIRTSKTVNGIKHEYFYSGGQLLRETYGYNILDFAYNSDGSLYSLRHNGTYYYYVTNLQGDVIGIVDANGNTVASYEYDPYGDVVSATGTLAEINPLRYRGYYYDAETGLYYCQSRYYDPEIGRFLNADAFASTGQGMLGNNMFAYCGNNPVVRRDGGGQLWEIIAGAAIGGAIAGALIGAVSYLVSSGLNGSEVTASGLLGSIVTGSVTGAVGAVGGALGGVPAIVGSVVVGVISGSVTAYNTEGSTSQKITAGLVAGLVSAAGTYLGTKIPVAMDSSFAAGTTAYTGGLFMGAQAEIANVAIQQGVAHAFSQSNSPIALTQRRQISAIAID